ncbi:MAG: flavodoxin [Pseudomonas sp.]|jgi:MioC protein|uniref:flavodoxin n=1 Tax=Pseudomonas sp. CFII64 TaxID=911242 RepID=UPI000357A75E|nr:flavodoxin [Pseudomonas sp. CFII64]EPJ75535.1 flavodoxin [Pseudomonas sp. CFII64]
MKVAIVSGSVYGSAEEVARHAGKLLREAGFEVLQDSRVTLEGLQSFAPQALLFVTSTTGMGELPDNIQPVYSQIRDVLPAAWRGLPGGVIGLGDASYGDTFCAGGEQIRELFAELGVVEVQEMLRLDASESVTPETDAEPWLEQFVKLLKKRIE